MNTSTDPFSVTIGSMGKIGEI